MPDAMTDAMTDVRTAKGAAPSAHILVVGNQKGGSGKSTTAMHLACALMTAGARVACLDLDGDQGSFGRYLENRRAHAQKTGLPLAVPAYESLSSAGRGGDDPAGAEALDAAVARLCRGADYLVIDTPGTDSPLARLGHALADTLITPLNDSFVDLDILASVDDRDHSMVKPGNYAEMVFQARISRAQRTGATRNFDWIVMRNRMGHQESRNRQAMERALAGISGRIGFRLAPGFAERTIYRELFLKGLTLLDVCGPRPAGGDAPVRLSLSHIAARQEIRDLMRAIGLPL